MTYVEIFDLCDVSCCLVRSWVLLTEKVILYFEYLPMVVNLWQSQSIEGNMDFPILPINKLRSWMQQ